MNKNEYLEMIDKTEIKDEKVNAIEQKYDRKLPEELKRIVSFMSETLFLDKGGRIISFNELVNAEDIFQVDVVGLGIVPVADIGDNDFIVFLLEKSEWARFNIVDECIFGEKKSFDEML